MIEWESDETVVLLNPRMPEEEKKRLEKSLPRGSEFKSHIWLTTSGTTSTDPQTVKCVALSRQSLLNSAFAVNEHLQSTAADCWLNPLPIFHVGGLGIMARAYLSGAKVISYTDKWDPVKFSQIIKNQYVTLTSLVPAQVYDLLKIHAKPPAHLRAIVVGGGALPQHLYVAARKLGWPLLPSYGLTESCSQVATASLEGHQLKPLKHVKIAINSDGFITIEGQSLLTSYAFVDDKQITLFDPKKNGVLTTEDYGIITESGLEVTGRGGDFKKIGGESVNMSQLNAIFQQVCLESHVKDDTLLIPFPDERLGCVVHLVTSGDITDALSKAIDLYNHRTMPFASIRNTWERRVIPRSPLGKPLVKQLIDLINCDKRDSKDLLSQFY